VMQVLQYCMQFFCSCILHPISHQTKAADHPRIKISERNPRSTIKKDITEQQKSKFQIQYNNIDRKFILFYKMFASLTKDSMSSFLIGVMQL
jgi:hypothetical protein